MFKSLKGFEKLNTKRKSRSILISSIVAVLIAISPYIFYTYQFFPNEKTLNLGFFVFESNFNQSVYTVMWFFMIKFIPLTLLTLWFFTCKHWWYHAILIPIAMYSFQIVSLFYEERYIDEAEIYWLVPIMLVITPFVYFIRVKLFDKHVLGIDLEAMDTELQELREKDRLRKEKEEKKS